MNSILHSSKKVFGPSFIQLNSRRVQFPLSSRGRNVSTTTGEPVEYSGYPKRIWVIVGTGAGLMYYLWHRGNASAQAAAGEETQNHHGPNKEKVKSPGDSVQKMERA
ncbi:hypothetical protein N7481_008706 [Penicillium waksmanii]|uniref:uncharacterized protein n=1 Tax=Penicillium waksmanii TaxID=69791 RepID=UPI0025494DEC|nr:uncharacterized protein N7481_008706 [Penicillium waksmanii]KAJ5974999.1 hypothetical protein N7481_008706 [Penicillium waksmanii]